MTISLILSTAVVHLVSYVAGAHVICIVICRGEVLHQLMHSLHSASLSRLNQWNSCLPVGKLWLRPKILINYILVLRLSENIYQNKNFVWFKILRSCVYRSIIQVRRFSIIVRMAFIISLHLEKVLHFPPWNIKFWTCYWGIMVQGVLNGLSKYF